MPRTIAGKWFNTRKGAANTATVASAARTTSGTGTAFDVGPHNIIEYTVTITAAGGTSPTLVVGVEVQIEGSANWVQVPTPIAQQTGTATARAAAIVAGANKARYYWTIGGTTPTFTFKIDDRRA
jgi:hypothetical protein